LQGKWRRTQGRGLAGKSNVIYLISLILEKQSLIGIGSDPFSSSEKLWMAPQNFFGSMVFFLRFGASLLTVFKSFFYYLPAFQI
jgi:hypothetical protein